MRTIKVHGQDFPVAFTTWTLHKFNKMTGINLYDPSGITKVFKKYNDGETITPDDFETVYKLAYCAMSAAILPKDADENWKPDFSYFWVMNGIPKHDHSIYSELLSAYLDRDLVEVIAEVEEKLKNPDAPIEAGQ